MGCYPLIPVARVGSPSRTKALYSANSGFTVILRIVLLGVKEKKEPRRVGGSRDWRDSPKEELRVHSIVGWGWGQGCQGWRLMCSANSSAFSSRLAKAVGWGASRLLWSGSIMTMCFGQITLGSSL